MHTWIRPNVQRSNQIGLHGRTEGRKD